MKNSSNKYSYMKNSVNNYRYMKNTNGGSLSLLAKYPLLT